MIGSSAMKSSRFWTERVGPALLLVGVISLAQAAGLFPVGESDLAPAVILTAIGGALSLELMKNRGRAVSALQSVLVVAAIIVVVVF